ncbi:MAG TPA: PQQ-dependent sugar dehydrogenase [Polyangia bacterium]
MSSSRAPLHTARLFAFGLLLLVPWAAAEAASRDPGCGAARPKFDGIRTAEGLVIAPDGTFYFTQPFGTGASRFLGRYRPPYTAPELRWLEIGDEALGTILDPQTNVLYVGSRSRKKLLAITLSEPPVIKELADVEPGINGLTLYEDGSVFYTDQKGGHLFRVTSEGKKTQVTTSPIDDPNGLAFGPDNRLYVLTYGKPQVTKLRLSNGREVQRWRFAELPGGKKADGIAFDAQGEMYVTAGDVFRISRDGKKVDRVGPAYGANADFGVGPLPCTDLFTAGNGQGITRVSVGTRGRFVPWHRRPFKETVSPPAPPPAAPARLARRVKLDLVTSETVEAVGLVAVPGEPVGRLFVVEKRGPIRILRGKTLAPKPFVDLTGKVSLWTDPNGEQGLLGLAFHPRYRENGRFFLHYTDPLGDTRVVEYKVDARDPDRADPTPVRQVLHVDQPHGNHNAGHLAFGPDGNLYVLLGDGGSADDPHGNGQKPDTLLAKMLRIDVDGANLQPTVLGKGMRNPWRYTFDRATGDLYIADVGQNLFEWVHWVPRAGLDGPHNFGWSVVEGKHCFKADTCDRAGIREPIVAYPHSEGCSITGGVVYRGKAIPALRGHYFYSDYCTALLRSVRMKDGKPVDSWDWKGALDPDSRLAKIAAFGEDQSGEVYVVTHEGPIYKLVKR